MGNQQPRVQNFQPSSSRKQSITPASEKQQDSQHGLFPSVSQMRLLSQGNDLRYGEIKIMQMDNGALVAVKQKTFQDEGAFDRFLKLTNQQIQSEQEPFLIQLLDIQHTKQNELCSTMIRSYSIYEYHQHDLGRDMEELYKQNKRYEEIEIVAMIHSILSALIFLQSKGQSHGDLRPQQILMTVPSLFNPYKQQNQVSPAVFKITKIQELTQMNAYKRCIANQIEDSIRLSPEQLNDLALGNLKPFYDVYKSDVFTLGLLALEMATMNNLSDIYNQDTFQIIPDSLEAHLQFLSTQYSLQLCQVIEQMLQFNPQQRPDPITAQGLLYPYQFQLEDYFNQVNIAQSLAYSMTINSAQFPQIQKPTEVYQQPILQAEPIKIEVQPEQVQKQITDNQPLEIDEQIKKALVRSRDVQERYIGSPVRKYASNKGISKPTNSLEQYQKLSPLNMADLNFASNSNSRQDQLPKNRAASNVLNKSPTQKSQQIKPTSKQSNLNLSQQPQKFSQPVPLTQDPSPQRQFQPNYSQQQNLNNKNFVQLQTFQSVGRSDNDNDFGNQGSPSGTQNSYQYKLQPNLPPQENRNEQIRGASPGSNESPNTSQDRYQSNLWPQQKENPPIGLETLAKDTAQFRQSATEYDQRPLQPSQQPSVRTSAASKFPSVRPQKPKNSVPPSIPKTKKQSINNSDKKVNKPKNQTRKQ